MLLSIIVPIYNQEKYLTRCLDSIYNQGLQEDDFELLLINDGSTDNSLAIMQSYANHHSNVRIISKDNEGLSATRNRGIKEAVGDYIYMPDSDDYLIANGLSYVIKNFLDDDIDVLMFYSQTIYHSSNLNLQECPDGNIVFDGYSRDYLKTSYNFPAWNLIIKSQILKHWDKIDRVFDTRTTMEDKLFNIDLALKNIRYRVVNSSIYRYIINPGTEMTSRNPHKLRQHIDSFVIILSEIQDRITIEKDKLIRNQLEKIARGIYIPFATRILLSQCNYKEIKNIIRQLKANDVIKPTAILPKLLFNFPSLFIMTRPIYKFIFDPYILPIIKRHNA